jgi:hypothetical protein
MLQLHRLVERLLRLGCAGDREVNRAEDGVSGMVVGGACGRRSKTEEKR